MENPDPSTTEFLFKAPLSSLDLFPCSQEAQGEQGGVYRFEAYNLKALLSQFLQELHSCQLSPGILQTEAVLPSRQCSLLDGAGWNAAPGLPVCMENSREARKEHQ